MAASVVLCRRARVNAAIVGRAAHAGRNQALAAAVVLLFVATAAADDHSTAIYELNRQTLEAVLAKWKIPCLLNRDWLDCSLLFSDYFVPNYYIKYPSTLTFKVNHISPAYMPTPSLLYLTCKYPKICAVITPIRPNGYTILPNILRQLYERTLLIAPTTTTYFPQTITENPFSSHPATDENVKFTDVNQLVNNDLLVQRNREYLEKDRQDYTVTPTTTTASILPIIDTIKSMSTYISPFADQNRRVTNTLRIPDVNEYHEIYDLAVSDKNEFKLVTKPDSTGNIIDSQTDSLNEVSEEDEASPGWAIPVEHRRDNLSSAREENNSSRRSSSDNIAPGNVTEEEIILRTKNKTFDVFKETLHRLERKFLLASYTKLTAISPEERRVNGISFLQSGLFLHLLLIALTTEVDQNVAKEIDDCLELSASNEDRLEMLRHVIAWLPESSDTLKFRWSSRLVVGQALSTSLPFRSGAAEAMNLTTSQLDTDDLANMTKTLNDMVTMDSGGTMHDTFEEEELTRGACGIALSTLYVRARWRAAPTLLNGTRAFHDGATNRSTRFFRVNDIVGYASVPDWNVQAIDIPYATPGLSLLVVVPKEPALGELVARVAREGLGPVLAAVRQLRAAVTLPLYTLRMTLLLPNKLQHMGIPSVVDVNNTDCSSLKLSHAVQRLMFWAEAGRNAYKDDGIEWDPHPEMEVTVDRPYLFFIRWHNVTLINGNFVL